MERDNASPAAVGPGPAKLSARDEAALTASDSFLASSSPWGSALRRFARNRVALVGLTILFLIALSAILAPLIATHDPVRTGAGRALTPPGREHFFGTDQVGRDIFSRVVHGGRYSLRIGFISIGIAVSIGVPLGLLAGYYGRWINTLIMRSIDLMLALPNILLALVIVASLGPGLTKVMIAVGIAAIPSYTRLTEGVVLSVRESLYVTAAKSIGVPDRRIIFRHILPNILAPIIVLASLGLAFSLLTAASLSFLGLGAQPPTPEWGAMANTGRNHLRVAWWITTIPGFAIMVTVLAFNLIGDGLRAALDPRLKA